MLFMRKCLIIKMVVGDGFEPSKALLADLQSAPFGHSGTPPRRNDIYDFQFPIFNFEELKPKKSTIENLQLKIMERVKGIEPS